MAQMSRYLKTGELLAILNDLWRGNDTGTLVLQREAVTKFLYFQDGQVIFAASNAPEDKFTQILMDQGRLTVEQVNLATQKRESRTLGRTLVDLGFISSEDLLEALIAQVRKIALSVAEWTSGTSSFKPNVLPPGVAKLPITTERLVVDTALGIRDRAWVGQTLGGLECVLKLSGSEREAVKEMPLTEGESRLLDAVDGRRTIREACEGAGMDVFAGAKFLVGLFYLQFVHRKEVLVPKPHGTEAKVDLSFLDEVVPAPAGRPAEASEPEPAAPEVGPTPFEAPEPPAFVSPEPPPPPPEAPFVAPEPPAAPPTLPLSHEPEAEAEAVAEPPSGLRFMHPEEPEEPPSEEEPQNLPEPLFPVDFGRSHTAEDAQGEPPAPASEILQPEPDVAPSPPPVPPRRKGARARWPMVAAAAAVIVIGGAAGGWWFLLGPGKEPASAPAGKPKPPAAAPSNAPVSAANAPAPASDGPTAPPAKPQPLPSEPVKPEPVKPEPVKPEPVKPEPAKPAPAPAGKARDLLLAGKYPDAAKAFQAELGKSRTAFAIDLEIACQPDTITKGRNAAMGNAAYMILPYSFRGKACYRVIWGTYGSRAEAEAALKTVPQHFLADSSPRVVPWSTVMPGR